MNVNWKHLRNPKVELEDVTSGNNIKAIIIIKLLPRMSVRACCTEVKLLEELVCYRSMPTALEKDQLKVNHIYIIDEY